MAVGFADKPLHEMANCVSGPLYHLFARSNSFDWSLPTPVFTFDIKTFFSFIQLLFRKLDRVGKRHSLPKDTFGIWSVSIILL